MRAKVAPIVGALLLAASAGAIGAPSDAPQAASPSQTDAPATRDLGGGSERLLGVLTRQSEATKAALERLANESDAAHARTVTRGRVYVRLARAGLLPVGGGFDALIEHAVRLERLHNALGRDLSLEREMGARRITLAEQLASLDARRTTLQTEIQAMSVARNALLSEQDRADAFARAFSSSVGSAHTAVYGAGVGPADSAPSGGFVGARGRLPFPITGRSEIRSARRAGSEGPGLEMFAPAGSVVRAVHAGRVAFADSYAAYGKTVILDHGGSYYTVSAGLDSIDVRVGDDLALGSRLGTVGAAPDGRARLYFEIRVGTGTVSPLDWFGI